MDKKLSIVSDQKKVTKQESVDCALKTPQPRLGHRNVSDGVVADRGYMRILDKKSTGTSWKKTISSIFRKKKRKKQEVLSSNAQPSEILTQVEYSEPRISGNSSNSCRSSLLHKNKDIYESPFIIEEIGVSKRNCQSIRKSEGFSVRQRHSSPKLTKVEIKKPNENASKIFAPVGLQSKEIFPSPIRSLSSSAAGNLSQSSLMLTPSPKTLQPGRSNTKPAFKRTTKPFSDISKSPSFHSPNLKTASPYRSSSELTNTNLPFSTSILPPSPLRTSSAGTPETSHSSRTKQVVSSEKTATSPLLKTKKCASHKSINTSSAHSVQKVEPASRYESPRTLSPKHRKEEKIPLPPAISNTRTHKSETKLPPNDAAPLSQPPSRKGLVSSLRKPSPPNKMMLDSNIKRARSVSSSLQTPKGKNNEVSENRSPRSLKHGEETSPLHLNNQREVKSECESKAHYLVVEVIYHGRSLDGDEKATIQKQVALMVDDILRTSKSSEQKETVFAERPEETSINGAGTTFHTPEKLQKQKLFESEQQSQQQKKQRLKTLYSSLELGEAAKIDQLNRLNSPSKKEEGSPPRNVDPLVQKFNAAALLSNKARSILSSGLKQKVNAESSPRKEETKTHSNLDPDAYMLQTPIRQLLLRKSAFATEHTFQPLTATSQRFPQHQQQQQQQQQRQHIEVQKQQQQQRQMQQQQWEKEQLQMQQEMQQQKIEQQQQKLQQQQQQEKQQQQMQQKLRQHYQFEQQKQHNSPPRSFVKFAFEDGGEHTPTKSPDNDQVRPSWTPQSNRSVTITEDESASQDQFDHQQADETDRIHTREQHFTRFRSATPFHSSEQSKLADQQRTSGHSAAQQEFSSSFRRDVSVKSPSKPKKSVKWEHVKISPFTRRKTASDNPFEDAPATFLDPQKALKASFQLSSVENPIDRQRFYDSFAFSSSELPADGDPETDFRPNRSAFRFARNRRRSDANLFKPVPDSSHAGPGRAQQLPIRSSLVNPSPLKPIPLSGGPAPMKATSGTGHRSYVGKLVKRIAKFTSPDRRRQQIVERENDAFEDTVSTPPLPSPTPTLSNSSYTTPTVTPRLASPIDSTTTCYCDTEPPDDLATDMDAVNRQLSVQFGRNFQTAFQTNLHASPNLRSLRKPDGSLPPRKNNNRFSSPRIHLKPSYRNKKQHQSTTETATFFNQTIDQATGTNDVIYEAQQYPSTSAGEAQTTSTTVASTQKSAPSSSTQSPRAAPCQESDTASYLGKSSSVNASTQATPSSRKTPSPVKQVTVSSIARSRKNTPDHKAWWMPKEWAKERRIGAFGSPWTFEKEEEMDRRKALEVSRNPNVEKIRTSNFIRL